MPTDPTQTRPKPTVPGPTARREYATPTLTRFGSIGRLTRQNGANAGEGIHDMHKT